MTPCLCGRLLSATTFLAYCDENGCRAEHNDTATHELRNCRCGTTRLVPRLTSEQRIRVMTGSVREMCAVAKIESVRPPVMGGR